MDYLEKTCTDALAALHNQIEHTNDIEDKWKEEYERKHKVMHKSVADLERYISNRFLKLCTYCISKKLLIYIIPH